MPTGGCLTRAPSCAFATDWSATSKEHSAVDALVDQLERVKAQIRAKVEHPFRVIKRQFGYTKVRYRGLKKNTLQIVTLFALSNLWMARHQLMQQQGARG